MKINLKIIPDSKTQEWVGWFGECLKVRLKSLKENYNDELITFVANDIGIPEKMISITNNKKDFIDLEIPDEAYEIIMSNVSSTASEDSKTE